MDTVGKNRPPLLGNLETRAPQGAARPLSKDLVSLPATRGLLEDKTFHEAIDQSLVEPVPYFCQFWNEQSARLMAQNSSLQVVPDLSPSSNIWEDREGRKELEEDKWRLEKKEEGEEEEEELEEEEEEEEDIKEEEEMGKEELEAEDVMGEKEEKLTWTGIEPALQPVSQESQKWQWQQQLKVIMKEEQERNEKEAISR